MYLYLYIMLRCANNRIDIFAIANTKLSKWLHVNGAKKISYQIIGCHQARADFPYEVISIKTKKKWGT